MIVETCYSTQSKRVITRTSIPNPTVEKLTYLVKHLAWVAEQSAPKVRIL